jgi:multidrug efflux pump subunit AcrA (membrane-fusion protein)
MKSRTPQRKRLLALGVLTGGLGIFSVAHTLKTAHASWAGAFNDLHAEPQSSDAPTAAPGVMAEGRVASYPDSEVGLSTELAGRLTTLAVHEGDQVHAGDLIAELDSEEIRASLRQEQAKQVEAEAQISYLDWRVPNVTQLHEAHAASVQEVKECERDLALARARQEQAAAAVVRLEAQLAKTRLLSPIDGTITSRPANPGQAVEPQTPIATVADLRKLRIEAEVNEFDAAGVAVGSLASVTAEGYPGVQWKARVEEIPDSIVTRHLRPQDPGRPTDTGILLAKLAFLEPTPLRLGQRVEVKLDAPSR